ncbi:PolC-type DNA polymerase III family protein [Pigmentibacter ruber]|uniref:hypothetical protein n=1 Tax=Pigmentibacter ruber TaxID=2683196 RepID=UPI00131CB03A|nr:hypothetical protein [Pigmentibacter ruber]
MKIVIKIVSCIIFLFFKMNTYSLNGYFYIKDSNDNFAIGLNSTEKSPFHIYNIKKNVVRIKPDINLYLSANDSKIEIISKNNASYSENFVLNPKNSKQTSIKTIHNTFLNINNTTINYKINQTNDEINLTLESYNPCDEKNLYYLRSLDGKFLTNTIDIEGNEFELSKNNNYVKICLNYKQKNIASMKINNLFLSANKDDNKFKSVRNDKNNEFFEIIKVKENIFNIKSFHNTFLNFEKQPDNRYYLRQTNVKQNFYLIPVNKFCNPDNLYFIKNTKNEFLQNNYDKNVNGLIFSKENKKANICINKKDNLLSNIKINNLFLSATQGSNLIELKNKNSLTESFILSKQKNNKFTIKTSNNTFFSSENLSENKSVLKQSNNENESFLVIPIYKNFNIENRKCYYIRNKDNIFLSANMQNIITTDKKNPSSIFCIDKRNHENELESIAENELYIYNLINKKYLEITASRHLNLVDNKNKDSKFIFKPVNIGSFLLKNINNNSLVINNNIQIINEDEFNNENDGLYFEEVNPINVDTKRNKDLHEYKSNFLALKNFSTFSKSKSKITNVPLNEFNTGSMCPAPRLAQYHYPDGGIDVYCLKISSDFRDNIPQYIKNDLIRNNIHQLDIYFLAQSKYLSLSGGNLTESLNVLRTHNWIFKNIPKTYKGSIYKQNTLMTVYSNNYLESNNINIGNLEPKGIQSNYLKPYIVYLHDNKISPDNVHLNFSDTRNLSLFFYSLVIDPVNEQRAVVTLHWLLEPNELVLMREQNELLELDIANISINSIFQTIENTNAIDNNISNSLKELIAN